MAGFIYHPDGRLVLVLDQFGTELQLSGLSQETSCPVEARINRRRIRLSRKDRLDSVGDESIASGQVVKRKVVTDGDTAFIATKTGGIPHMAILAGFHGILVAAELGSVAPKIAFSA